MVKLDRHSYRNRSSLIIYILYQKIPRITLVRKTTLKLFYPQSNGMALVKFRLLSTSH